MPARLFQPCPSFNGVAASATATLDLPIGETYHGVTLEYREAGTLAVQADMEDAISEVRVNINGITVRRLSAEDIIDINAYHGIAFQAGYLPLLFSEPWRRDALGEDALAFGTDGLQSFQIEVDLSSGATTPTLKASKDVEQLRRPLGQIKKMLKKNIPISATGENTVQGDVLDSLHAIHCKSANITNVKIKTDSREVLNATAEQIFQRLKNYGKAPQTGYVHIDFAPTRRIGDVLEMARPTTIKNGKPADFVRVQDFPITFTMGSAASFNVVEERIGLVI